LVLWQFASPHQRYIGLINREFLFIDTGSDQDNQTALRSTVYGLLNSLELSLGSKADMHDTACSGGRCRNVLREKGEQKDERRDHHEILGQSAHRQKPQQRRPANFVLNTIALINSISSYLTSIPGTSFIDVGFLSNPVVGTGYRSAAGSEYLFQDQQPA
jgi:hypothetical protein